jgi:hypothetical protein
MAGAIKKDRHIPSLDGRYRGGPGLYWRRRRNLHTKAYSHAIAGR